MPVGESGLAGSIVLAIMALPTIITVTEDAMRNCPRAMREASLALGASQWQTIYKVVIPYSISGITSGVVLGIGRAVGETMAVLMVTGNAAVIPPYHPGTAAHHSGNDCRRTRRSACRRSSLRSIVPAGCRAVLHQFIDKLHGGSSFAKTKIKEGRYGQ